MVGVLSSPGVYAMELPSGVRPVASASTSVTAFLGRALRGPADRAVPITSVADFDRIFGGLWIDSPLGYMVHQYFRNGGVEAVITRLAPAATPAGATLAASGTPATLNLSASNPGEWGRNLRVTIVRHGDRFDLSVIEINPAITALDDPARIVRREEFFDLSVVTDDSRRVDNVIAAASTLIVVTQRPGAAPTAVNEAPLTGGSHGTTPAQADYEAGLTRLERSGGVSMVCLAGPQRQTVPPQSSNDVPLGAWESALTWCARMRAMLLVDPPASWSGGTPSANLTAAAALTDRTSLTHANAVFYYPNLEIADPLRSGRPMPLGPASTAAGVIARTDGTRGVWKAPAGADAAITGLLGLGASLDDAGGGRLNQVGVNAIRSFRDTGAVLWGARSAVGANTRASQWKYLPVRRLALHIEESLVQGLQWVVFEPNDEKLWAQLRLNVGAFMNDLFRQGAFQGRRASEAYFVKCDGETTFPSDVNRGIVNVVVGFAPLKPAEFVVLQFQQILRAA